MVGGRPIAFAQQFYRWRRRELTQASRIQPARSRNLRQNLRKSPENLKSDASVRLYALVVKIRRMSPADLADFRASGRTKVGTKRQILSTRIADVSFAHDLPADLRGYPVPHR
jgi:hypothetical protein